MDIEIPNWKKLADVKWTDHPLSIFEQNGALLMLLAEKRQDRTIGYACSACKPYIVKGDAAQLGLAHFASELTLVKKINASSISEAFLLAFTKPVYVQVSKTAIANAADQQAKLLTELHYDVKSQCKAVTLLELESKDNNLLSDPSLLFSFLSFLRSAARPQVAKSVLGLDLRGDKVQCAVPALSLSLVVGGSRQQRLHALHVLAEEVIQQNVCVVAFDVRGSFAGLSRPSGFEVSDFAAFSLPGVAAGFPMREVIPGKNSFVPMSTFSPQSILAPFGLNNSELSKYLLPAVEQGDLTEVEASEVNQFTKLKLNRVVKVLQSAFQGVFSRSNSPLELQYNFGKVIHINLASCSPEARAFYCMGFLRQLQKTDKPLFLLFEQDASEIKSLLEMAVDNFAGTNVSILCHADHEDDVPFAKSADFFVEVIDKDVAITQGGKPPQRVKLRPTYSACSEG